MIWGPEVAAWTPKIHMRATHPILKNIGMEEYEEQEVCKIQVVSTVRNGPNRGRDPEG